MRGGSLRPMRSRRMWTVGNQIRLDRVFEEIYASLCCLARRFFRAFAIVQRAFLPPQWLSHVVEVRLGG